MVPLPRDQTMNSILSSQTMKTQSDVSDESVFNESLPRVVDKVNIDDTNADPSNIFLFC